MSTLSAEIHGESIHLSRERGAASDARQGRVLARIKGLEDGGEVLLEARGKTYRLRLDGTPPRNLRRGARVLVRGADLPESAVLSPPCGETRVGGAAARALSQASPKLDKAWRGPWGELRLGRDLAKMFSSAARQGRAAALDGVKDSVVDLGRPDTARRLQEFVRNSGLFYESKVAGEVLGEGKADEAKLSGDLKHRLYSLRQRSGDEGVSRAAAKILEGITAHQLAARDEELYFQRSVEIPYWDGEEMKSMGMLWRRPRGEGEHGPYSVTLLLREGELGMVQVNLMADHGRLEVNVNAAAEESCRRLAGGVDELLGALRGAGWQVSSVNVRQREFVHVDSEA